MYEARRGAPSVKDADRPKRVDRLRWMAETISSCGSGSEIQAGYHGFHPILADQTPRRRFALSWIGVCQY